METGDKHPGIGETANLHSLFTDTHLVINLRYDGLTLLVADASKKQVLEIWEKTWPLSQDTDHLLSETALFFDEKKIALNQLGSAHWILSFSKFVLVPDIFFDQENSGALLRNSARLSEDELVHADFWTAQDAVCVYAVPQKLRDYILSQFEKSTIAHCGHSLHLLQSRQGEKNNFSLLNISTSIAELYIVKSGKLVFFNQFQFDKHEDLLYYILFALEQNRILAPELELRVAGKIQKGDSLYQTLSTYIGKVQEIDLPAGVRYARDITPNVLRRHAHLIASL